MDAFKLLTRSTKLKGPKTASSTPAATTQAQATATSRLPSTGQAQNPQLFRNPEAERSVLGAGAGAGAKNGKKRKRGHVSGGSGDAGTTGGGDEDGDEGDMNLDFFSMSKKKSTAVDGDGRDAQAHDAARGGESGEREEEEEEEEQPMDEIQRRTILNSHKIKVTDLRDLEEIQPAQVQVQEKEPKKKKKKKNDDEKKKQEPTQLSKKDQKNARRLFPQPLLSFKELRTKYKISRRLSENVAEQGFTVPTEVQLGSLPLLLGEATAKSKSKSGETEATEPDLLVIAPTGSGKTLAFLIPIVNKIVRLHHQQQEERGIFSVIVAPTKELAGQIVNEGRKLCLGTGVKVTMMKKGMRVVEREDEDEDEKQDTNVLNEDSADSSSSEEEEEEDDAGDKPTKKKNQGKKAPVTKSDILVTTPLLLVNALSANGTKPMAPMPLVRSLVLDEADVLLDPLFREQTLNIWHSCTHPSLRVSLWSATMGSNIEDLSQSTIKQRRATLNLTSQDHQTSPSSPPLLRLVVGLKDSAIPNISHKLIYAATEQGKLLGLRQLLHPAAAGPSDTRLRPPFLIFTQTIPRAVALHSELMYDIPPEAGGSSRIAVLHSDLSDTARSEIMKNFRKGELWILVTTDLLARGIDFRGINGVVNYDIPNSAAVYVHRVGRTGRAGREGGVAVTYYTKEDIPYVKAIANVIDVSERLRGDAGGGGGEKSIQKWLLDALPDLSKKNKKELKKHGVKARQVNVNVKGGAGGGKDDKEQRRTRISTKSGYDRRMENKRKGAIAASRSRKARSTGGGQDHPGTGSDEDGWSGFEN